MNISIITVFPELHEAFLSTSIISRAIDRGLLKIDVRAFSSYCAPKERIDTQTVGPGSGMLIKPEVVQRAIEDCEGRFGSSYKIFFSPHGEKLSQPVLHKLARHLQEAAFISPEDEEASSDTKPHLLLVCARYEGMDARVEEHYADQIISIGDYVLMGGDIPAQVLLEGLLRLIPDVVGKKTSVEQDSFTGAFLDYPEYSLPVKWEGMVVPSIVQSGNHSAIDEYRKEQAAIRTIMHRFDWFSSHVSSKEDKKLGASIIPSHYVVLMHNQVYVKDKELGNTSITSLDLHDIARSCATYGVKGYYVVSALVDQQRIVDRFLEFWRSEQGRKYNPTRFDALKRLKIMTTLNEVLLDIAERGGSKPLLVATSARQVSHTQHVSFADQGTVWQKKRAVAILLGTGQGLSDELVASCDYLLPPVGGLPDYKHLSVRSAAAIILDRWLGINRETPNGS